MSAMTASFKETHRFALCQILCEKHTAALVPEMHDRPMQAGKGYTRLPADPAALTSSGTAFQTVRTHGGFARKNLSSGSVKSDMRQVLPHQIRSVQIPVENHKLRLTLM